MHSLKHGHKVLITTLLELNYITYILALVSVARPHITSSLDSCDSLFKPQNIGKLFAMYNNDLTFELDLLIDLPIDKNDIFKTHISNA